jgi:hypothetical protein
MPLRRLPLLFLAPASRCALITAALVTAALVAAGCGGGDEADSGTDVDKLLEDTFSGDKKVESGRLDLSLRVEASGGAGGTQLQGPVDIRLEGPFQSQGEGKLPQFSFNASLQGAGQNLQAGVTSTGEKGFVKFQNADYAVSDEIFRQFRTGWEQAQKESGGGEDQSLASLGIDPRKWLTNARNAGEAKVGDADTIKITGDVDVPKLLDDVNSALQRARSLGGQAGQGLPEQLTDEQKRQAAEAIKALDVEIYTGKEDTILRRIVVDLDVAANTAGQGGQGGKVRFDLQLLDLNEDQEVSEPDNPRPFDELVGSLSGLLGGQAAGGAGAGGASSENLEQYSQCIEEAGSDADKARECADLLTP